MIESAAPALEPSIAPTQYLPDGLSAAIALLLDPHTGCEDPPTLKHILACANNHDAYASQIPHGRTLLSLPPFVGIGSIRTFVEYETIVGWGEGDPPFRALAAAGRVFALHIVNSVGGERSYCFAIHPEKAPPFLVKAPCPRTLMARLCGPLSVVPPVVEYVGDYSTSSGYASAARGNIRGLLAAGVTVRGRRMFGDRPHAHGADLLSIENEKAKPEIQILHSTPELWSRHRNPRLPAIGVTVFETDRIPASWPALIRESGVSEVWVPTKHSRDLFRREVEIPVRIVPHVVEPVPMEMETVPLALSADTFMFLSVFHWSTRKNPEGLLRAYCAAFSRDDDVVLVIKTNGSRSAAEDRVDAILDTVPVAASRLPRVLVLAGDLTEAQMAGLHFASDCYVSAHRAEGWGLPITEAMRMGRPVIATRQGGPAELIGGSWFGRPGWLVDGTLGVVSGMEAFEWYDAFQLWTEPDQGALRRAMREAYEAPDEKLAEMGHRGRRTVRRFAPERVGLQMRSLIARYA